MSTKKRNQKIFRKKHTSAEEGVYCTQGDECVCVKGGYPADYTKGAHHVFTKQLLWKHEEACASPSTWQPVVLSIYNAILQVYIDASASSKTDPLPTVFHSAAVYPSIARADPDMLLHVGITNHGY